jgi:hypothetical protein
MLRYVPRAETGEFYNIGLVVYTVEGGVVDARFTPDFDRMRCNPAVELELLSALRREFEDALMLGEDFTGYIERLTSENKNGIEQTDPSAIFTDNLPAYVERLVQRKLATPAALEDGRARAESAAGRSAVRRRMTQAFESHGLFRNGHGLQREYGVEYGPSGMRFVFDFQYDPPAGPEQLVHAMGLRAADAEAGRLCFVLDEYRTRSRREAGLTVVADDALGDDVRNLLGDRGIGAVNLSNVDAYAESIREKLGL